MLPDNNLIIGVVVGLLVLFLAWFSKEISRAIKLGIRKTLLPFEAQLQIYRKQLEEDTLKIHHSWMKEGQTLKDILISVNVLSKSSNEIENLQDVLKHQFSSLDEGKTPRILVLGHPGSGKSVALKVAAQESWDIPKQTDIKIIVPVIITFSDFKKFNYNLENAIIDSFISRKFSKKKTPKKNEVTNFVSNNLYNGNILVLIDALDELDIKDRTVAANELLKYLKNYSKISAIISCRSAVYKRQLDEIISLRVEMADFSPIEMNLFIQNWKFDPPKSATGLWLSIRDNLHLMELAKNPLILTIIAYLYSHPKYRLPENRALFYDVCCRALLEEWDQAMNPLRANKFDRPHKEDILGRLAYMHLTSKDLDKDIDFRKALEYFNFWMDDLGLRRSENTKMLNEIIDNSGLLRRIPPDGLRFPHQTFLEYFAALYFTIKNNPSDLITKYQTDPQRWREVLLLYVGLTPDVNNSSMIINYLFENDAIELTINSLSDSRIFDPKLADKIIDRAKDTLISDPSLNLVKNLGILSSNPRLALRSKVNQMLLNSLYSHEDLSDALLQEVILSVLQIPTQKTIQFIIENYERLNLQKIILNVAEKEYLIVNQLIAFKEFSTEKKLELIEGLRLSDKSEILINLMISSKDSIIKTNSAIALARLSKGIDFWKFINSKDLPQISNENKILNIEKKFGWPFDKPYNIEGKRILYMICYYFAKAKEKIVSANLISDEYIKDKYVHPRLAYLTNMISTEGYLNRFVWRKINKNGFTYLIRIFTIVGHSEIKRKVLYIFPMVLGIITMSLVILTTLPIDKEVFLLKIPDLTAHGLIVGIFVGGLIVLAIILTRRFLEKITYLYYSLQTDIP